MKKVFDIVTPFMGMAVLGLLAILEGIVKTGRENNILQYIFGIPILLGSLAFHFFLRLILQKNTLYIWIVEGVIVAAFSYLFFYRW